MSSLFQYRHRQDRNRISAVIDLEITRLSICRHHRSIINAGMFRTAGLDARAFSAFVSGR
jgi:hypothetical protein